MYFSIFRKLISSIYDLNAWKTLSCLVHWVIERHLSCSQCTFSESLSIWLFWLFPPVLPELWWSAASPSPRPSTVPSGDWARTTPPCSRWAPSASTFLSTPPPCTAWWSEVLTSCRSRSQTSSGSLLHCKLLAQSCNSERYFGSFFAAWIVWRKTGLHPGVDRSGRWIRWKVARQAHEWH